MSVPRDLAAEGAREGSRFARGFKFEAKGGLVELKDPWRDPVSIEPMSHLGHWPDQSAAAPPANPHNVHRDSSEDACLEVGSYARQIRGLVIVLSLGCAAFVQ
jgi:hypothetical protein